MTDQTQKHACPNCGATSGIYARADLRWNGERWELCPPNGEDEFDCTACDHTWHIGSDRFPDPFAGLGYTAPSADAPPPTGKALAHALRSLVRILDGAPPLNSQSHADEVLKARALLAAIGEEG